MLKNARFETSATNDASTALQILPSQKPETKLMDIVFSRRRRVEAGAFSDLKKHTTFTKTHSRHIFTIKKSCKLRNPPKSLKALGHTHVYNFCSKIYNFDRKQLQNLSRSAAIALKTSEIERTQFSASKLYSTFLFNSEKYFFCDRSKKNVKLFGEFFGIF